jgi:hypothetical protein
MTEKPKKSWAEALPQEADVPEPKEEAMMDASAKVESLKIGALYQIVKVLSQIEEELKLQRILFEKVNDVSVTIEETEETGETDTGEAGPTSQRSRGEDGPKPIPVVVPTNLKDSKQIEDFYRTEIAKTKVLGDTEMGKLLITVEENFVRIKLPWLSDLEVLKAAAKVLRAMGGEYVKDGANTHYKMPKPATT